MLELSVGVGPGTGKTTLSTDPARPLIGDDEHCWSDRGVFNIEGGCYAKCIGLKRASEPEIWKAIRFGTVLENVVFDENTREVDFDNKCAPPELAVGVGLGYGSAGHCRMFCVLSCTGSRLWSIRRSAWGPQELETACCGQTFFVTCLPLSSAVVQLSNRLLVCCYCVRVDWPAIQLLGSSHLAAGACSAVTENTRASYPIEYIDNAKIPCVGPHPKNLILLCCDAFGVLPPVSRLTREQAMYHFISGYTAKARPPPCLRPQCICASL